MFSYTRTNGLFNANIIERLMTSHDFGKTGWGTNLSSLLCKCPEIIGEKNAPLISLCTLWSIFHDRQIDFDWEGRAKKRWFVGDKGRWGRIGGLLFFLKRSVGIIHLKKTILPVTFSASTNIYYYDNLKVHNSAVIVLKDIWDMHHFNRLLLY